MISLKLSLMFDLKVHSCITVAKFCEDVMIQRWASNLTEEESREDNMKTILLRKMNVEWIKLAITWNC